MAQHDYPKPKLKNKNWQRPMGINNEPMRMSPQTQPTLQAPLQLPQNPQSQLCPQLPAQPHPNPNNRPPHLVYIMENGEGETSSIGCIKLQLRSGRIISPEENNVFQEQESEKQPTITTFDCGNNRTNRAGGRHNQVTRS